LFLEIVMTDTAPPSPDTPLPTILLGRLNVSSDVLPALQRNGQSLLIFLDRHTQGQWGEVDPPTRQANIRGVLSGFRIKSLYRLNDRTLIAIRTNAGRTETTVDLEDE
jgi:hypothetical protein